MLKDSTFIGKILNALVTFGIAVKMTFLPWSKHVRNFNLFTRRKESGRNLPTRFASNDATFLNKIRTPPIPDNGLVFTLPAMTNRFSFFKVRTTTNLLVGNDTSGGAVSLIFCIHVRFGTCLLGVLFILKNVYKVMVYYM